LISENLKEKSSGRHLLPMQKLQDSPGQKGQRLTDGPWGKYTDSIKFYIKESNFSPDKTEVFLYILR
jgi:hypothetical protein